MIFPNDNKDVDLSCIESTCVCLPVQMYLSTVVGALLCIVYVLILIFPINKKIVRAKKYLLFIPKLEDMSFY